MTPYTNTMELQNLQLRNSLISSLNSIITKTEEIYLGFAKEYPKLLKETNTSLSRAQAVCREFALASGSNDRLGLAAAVNKTQELIRSTISTMNSMEEDDDSLFSRLEEGIQSISTLGARIEHIKEDSIEMEIISLNAMTVALKAGSSGRAFSYITEELKRLSTKIISLTDGVTQSGEQVLTNFNNLRGQMNEVSTFQARLFDRIEEECSKTFTDFLNQLQNITTGLSDLVEQARSINVPLTKIMEETQHQDLIRQSIEHVIISLDELKSISAEDSPEQILDELTFLQTMPRLCIAVLNEVSDQISTSKKRFMHQLANAKDTVTRITKTRRSVLEEGLYGNGRDLPGLERNFDALRSGIAEMMSNLHEVLKKKLKLGDFSLDLLREIQALNASFKYFTSLITRFQTIDIASRIEVAKNEVLSQMTSTVQEMTDLTRRIGTDVDESYSATNEFLLSSEDTIHTFRDQFQQEGDEVRRKEQLLSLQLTQVETQKAGLTESLKTFSVFTDNFHSLFSRTEASIDQLDTLLDEISSISSNLESIEQEALTARRQLMEEQEIHEWGLHNEKLKRIIQRFTIFSHKKAAGDLGGFEVGEATASGDVTLF